MKKNICVAFVILILLTSCTHFSDTSSPSKNVSQSESGISSAELESPAFATDPSASENMLSSEDAGRLERSAIELLMAGTFSLHFTMDLVYPDFEYQLDCIMAQDGDKYVFSSEGDVPLMGHLRSRIISKDGHTYFVDDVEKTYSSSVDSEDEEAALDFNDMELLSKGSETLNGIQCEYEEYRIDDANMRFYFDSKYQLYAIKGIAETVNSTLDDSMYGDLLIMVKDIAPLVPADIFNIPPDYTDTDAE